MTSTEQAHEIAVSHYSGCGNDFLLFDNRDGLLPHFSDALIKDLCAPKQGAGVDGLIIVGPSKTGDVSMKYYNCDGFEAEMCGNGVRCLMQYLREKLHYPRTRCLLETKLRELLVDIIGSDVAVHMGEVKELGWNIQLEFEDTSYTMHYLDTGVPHVVIVVEQVDNIDVQKVGAFFRYHERFAPKGTNVNFVEICKEKDTSLIRTYERGVERETLACGTGVCAAAYVLHKLHGLSSPISLRVQSGEWLQVLFDLLHGQVDNFTLKGPATWIRDGKLSLNINLEHFTLNFA